MITKYYISFDGTTYSQIYLSNEPIVKIDQEAGEIFFRKKVDKLKIGALKNGTVYTTLESYWFDSTKFGIEIHYKININGDDKFIFCDTIRSGSINTQNKIYECTPEPDDDYKPIMRFYNKKYDNTTLLFGLAASMYYPIRDTNNFINSTFDAFTCATGHITFTHSGTPNNPQYASRDIANPANGTIVTIIIKNYTITGGGAGYMVLSNTPGGTEYSNKATIANGKIELLMTGVPATIILTFQFNNLTGISQNGSFDYEVYVPTNVLTGDSLYNVLDTVINGISYFNLSYDIVSTILWNDSLESDPPASINTYITANPANDYVIESAALWNYLWLARVDSFTTAKDDNIELCLKDVMDFLKTKRFWWFIDSNGKFRIEHDKYFRSYDPQIDLTAAPYIKPEVDRKSYIYDQTGYNQINLIENNIANEDWFPAKKIEYDPKMTGDNIQDIRGSMTTDIKNIIDNAATISSGGLTLLRMNANNCVQFDESLVTPGTYYPNQKLSPLWFARYYMNYFAETEAGTVNGSYINIIHVRETLKQTGVRFYDNSDLTWKKPFTMSIGNGWLTSAEYNPETGFWNINVGYNPFQISIPFIPGGTMGSTTADSTETTVDSTLITVDET